MKQVAGGTAKDSNRLGGGGGERGEGGGLKCKRAKKTEVEKVREC